MNKKRVKTLIVCLGGIYLLLASPLWALPPKPLAETPTRKTTDSYTDFTGVWESLACRGQRVTLAMEQTEHYFSMERGPFESIGTLITETSSGDSNLEFETAGSQVRSIEWNSDKTQLFFRSIAIQKPTTKLENPAEKAMYFQIRYNSIALNQEGQLLLKTKGMEYQDLQLVDEWDSEVCVFTKIEDHPTLKKTTPMNLFRK